MKIYTSYYANIKRIPKNYILVSISRYKPEDIKVDYHIKDFAPSKEILFNYKRNNNQEEYVSRFIKQDINFKKEFTELFNKYGNKNYVLLCYEKPLDFCHRHIIAELIGNDKIKEYGYEEYEAKNGLLFNKLDLNEDF